MKCFSCGYENLPGMKFCGQCGIRLGQTCQNCGFVNPPEHRFCGQCGTRLEEQPVPAVPAELTKTEPVSSPRVEMPDVAMESAPRNGCRL